MTRLGIIGGLGPQTSCDFCLGLNRSFQKKADRLPEIVLENLPVSKKAEEEMIHGKVSNEHFFLLRQAVKRLNQAEADLIVIPCNTVHCFLERLQKESRIPIINIIEESTKECLKKEFKTVGLLSTPLTKDLFKKESEKRGLKLLFPDKKEQKRINNIILELIHNSEKPNHKKTLLKIVHGFQKRGAEAIILGCTDLPLIIKEEDSSLPLVNTLAVLEKAAIESMEE